MGAPRRLLAGQALSPEATDFPFYPIGLPPGLLSSFSPFDSHQTSLGAKEKKKKKQKRKAGLEARVLSVVLKIALARGTARPQGRSPNAGDSHPAGPHDSGAKAPLC